MMIGYYDYVVPAGAAEPAAVADRDKRRAEDLFDRLDQNADGKVVETEVPRRFRAAFKQLDADNDDALDLDELSKVLQFLPPRDR